MKKSLLVTVVVLLGTAATPAAAAVADPERYSTTPTAWAWYFTASPATISSYLAANNMRLIDLEVVSANPITFSAVMVRNTGVYGRGWSWWYDQTSSSLSAKLPGNRLLDLETYLVNGQRRYAAVLVANGGTNFHDYRWYLNSTPSFISGRISAFGGRIVDIDKVSTGRYNVVLIKNSGVDARSWWYYYARTPAQIGSLLSANHARLVDIEPDGSGLFTVVMVRAGSEFWVWYPAMTSSEVTEIQAQAGMRIYDLERYVNAASQVRYAVLLINNVDSLTTRLRQIMWPAAKTAAFGFYLKQVDGSRVTGLQERKVFEPASMIKALHHITAMLSVKNTSRTVDDMVTWYANPDWPERYPNQSAYGTAKNICAYEDDGTPLTSQMYSDKLGDVILKQMMQQSDNRTTDAVYNLFGPAAINATADSLGMTQTQLYHRIGCPGAASPQPFHSNELTLYDDGLLFESVARSRNPVLGTGIYRTQFYSYMGSGLNRFATVVNEEALSLGKSGSAQSFINNMRGVYKPGGYLNGVEGYCNQQGCTKLLSRSTGGGWISLPFKQGGTIVPRSYVYGNFVDGIFDCGGRHTEDNPLCQPQFDAVGSARESEFKEMLRPQIRAALITWP